MEYTILNTSYAHTKHLGARDSIRAEVSSEAGKVSASIRKDDEKPVYQGENIPTSAFTVTVEEPGDYTITVTGENASGERSVHKSEEWRNNMNKRAR